MAKRITALLLAMLMLVSAAACAEKADKDDTADTAAEQTEEVTEDDAPKEELPDLPAMDFEGKTFTFIVRGESYSEWASQDIFAEEQNGEPVNDAVIERNIYLEENYKCKIEQFGASDVGAQAKKSISAGSDDYQVVMANTQESGSLATQQLLYDLNEVEYLDLSRSWWDQRSVELLSIGNILYFMTGDNSIMANDATWILMFNKKMITDNNLENPYDLVNGRTWTVDKMLEMASGVASDLNGDGKYKYTDDQFGFATHDSSNEGFFFGAGCRITSKDEEDIPYIDLNVDRATSLLERGSALMSDKSIVVNASVLGLSSMLTDLQPVFESGRSLFYGEVMQCIIRLREMEIDFGVLPFPMFDESQESYNHFIHVTACMTSIPVSNPAPEDAGFILEAMAAKSKYTLRKAYYEVCLTTKFARDEESAEMLDIIISTRAYDIGYIYGWGSLFSSFNTCMDKGNTDYASKVAKSEKAANRALDKAVSKWLGD